YHGRVDEGIQEEIGADAEAEQSPELATAAQRDRKGVDDYQDIKGQQHQAADKAEFLGEHREDEIGLLLRQKAQMALRAEQKTLAEQPAGAERDLRLHDVITGAERVGIGLEEGIEPGLLVVAQERPGDRGRGRGGE